MGTLGAYQNPLRPKVTIKTIDGEDTLYTFNAYNSSNDISLATLSASNAVGEMGDFSMTINDHNNEIPKDNIHDVKVKIEFGKTSGTLKTFLIGYGHIFNIDRPGTNAQFYGLSGLGSKSWAYDLYIHRHERYERGSNDARISTVVKNAFTKRLWRPLKKQDESIQDITGWQNEISTTIGTPYTTIDESFVYFGEFLDKLADITGAVWFIDFDGDDEELVFKNKAELNTNIRLKSGDLADKVNDSATKTSYFESPFSVEDASNRDAGFANRLFSSTFRDDDEIWPLDAVNYAKSSTNLNNKALGQQVIIQNDARRIKTIRLHLRKIGEPDSPNSRINGGVFMDKDNKPNMTFTLDTFKIDLSSIEEEGKKIDVPVDISESKLDRGETKIWVVLFQRSGTSGDPQDDPDNTVVWGHNNSLATEQKVNGVTVFSGQAPGGDFDSKSKLSWQTTNQGPTYSVEIFSDIRRLFARTNGRSKRTQRLREVFVPSEFLRDPSDISRYLSLILSQSSKTRRGIADLLCSVPDNFLFKPYQNVAFHDGLSDVDEIMQVQRAGYDCSAFGDDSPLGTLDCNLTLLGSYNTLIGSCQCL